MPSNGPPPAVTDRPVTCSAAEEIGAFGLAGNGRRTASRGRGRSARQHATSWRTCPHWPHGCDAGSQSTFTVRSSLVRGLRTSRRRWAAALTRRSAAGTSGHRPSEVSSSVGDPVTEDEYQAVAQRFAAAGIKP